MVHTQVEALRGELTALREEGGRKLEDLEARLQDHIESSKRLEQLRTADSDRHKDEVGSLLEWRRKHSLTPCHIMVEKCLEVFAYTDLIVL